MSIDRRRYGYLPLRDAIDQLFEGSFISPGSLGAQQGFPPADMHVTDDDVVLEMAIPGARPDDIHISVTGDTVTITGEVTRRQHGEKTQHYYDEIWRGRFQRSFQLPIQVDANKADACFDHGVLTLKLPKSEATKPRKIQVRTQQAPIQGETGGSQSKADTQTETVPVQGKQ